MSVASITEMVSQTAYSYSPKGRQRKRGAEPDENVPEAFPGEEVKEECGLCAVRTGMEAEYRVTDDRPEPFEEANAQMEAIRKAFRKKQTQGYNAAADMIQLASACTILQVRAIRGRVMRQYIQSKGSGGSRTVLAAMKRVIAKAGTKIKRLKVENALKAKKKMAQRMQEKEKEKKLQNLLDNRRRKRRQKEYNDILDELRSPRSDRNETDSGPEAAPPFSTPPSGTAGGSGAVLPDAAGLDTAPDVSIDILL